MDVLVAALTVPDLDAAIQQGSSHPLLGPYLDGGSYGAIAGVAGAAEVLAAAASAGEGVRMLGDPSPADLRGGGERGALCLVVTDGAGRIPPFAVLYGRALPALGALPACTLQDLQHTWTALAGGKPKDGRHLLHEQPEDWDPQLERRLTQRLRQLYGE